MFRRLFWHKKGVTHILAIDLGTASISAAVAERGEKTAVLKVLRYPIDLFGYQVSGEAQRAQLPHILKDGFLKIFKDAFAVSRHLDVVAVGLSDPFFLDKKTLKKITRPNPMHAIGAEEMNIFAKALEGEVGAPSLAIISREILNTKVNGYEVENAAGFKGKTLETEIVFTLVSSALKEYMESAREKFFPKSSIYYYSDAAIFRKALKAAENLSEPNLVVDVGGEVTGVFWADAWTIQHCGASAFGIRTLSRRVAASLKTDALQTDSLLRKYTSGTLDEAIQAKISRVVALSLADWWMALENVLKQCGEGAVIKKMVLSGGGAEFQAFAQVLKDGFKKDFNSEIDIRILRAEAFKDFLASAPAAPVNFLTGGGDLILTSLAIFAPW